MAPVQEPTEITEKSQLKFKITKKKRPEPKPEPAPEKQPQMFKVSLKKVKKRILNYAREVEEWVPEERLQEIVQDGPTEIVRIIEEDSLLADTAEGEEVEVKKSKPAKKKKPEPKKKEEPEEKTEMFKISLKKVKKRPIRYAQECEEWNSVEETEDFVSDAPAEIISFVDDEVEDASDLAEVLEETVDVQQAKTKTKRTKKQPEPKPKEAEKKLVPFTVSLKKVKKKPIHYAREAEEWVSIEEVEEFEPELATEVVQFDLMEEEETIEASVSETDILKSKAKKKKRPIQKMEDKPEETPGMFKMTLKKVPKKPTKILVAEEEEREEIIEEEKVSMEILTETIEMSAEEVVEEGLYVYWLN